MQLYIAALVYLWRISVHFGMNPTTKYVAFLRQKVLALVTVSIQLSTCGDCGIDHQKMKFFNLAFVMDG